VWFSCGAASAVAAKLTLEEYGSGFNIHIVNNPVKEEGEDNRRFLRDVQEWIGVEIEDARNPKYPSCSAEDVWRKKRYMSGVKGAPCTSELKKEARYEWERHNPVDWHVLGFTSEEGARHRNFVLTERSNVIPVLIDAGLNKDDCAKILTEAGIDLPEAYKLGYPNANCRGCVKATSPTYWNLVRQVDPEVFERRATQSRELGCRLTRYQGKRIFLDELPANAKGRPVKSLVMPECGIFCEERHLTRVPRPTRLRV
jgi:hypothetical protein